MSLSFLIFLAYAIFGIYLFHQVFTVFYFNLGNGLFRELLCGLIFAVLALLLGWATDIVLAIMAYKSYQANRKILFYVCIGFLILTTIIGILLQVTK